MFDILLSTADYIRHIYALCFVWTNSIFYNSKVFHQKLSSLPPYPCLARLYFRGMTLKYCGAHTNFRPVKLLPATKKVCGGVLISPVPFLLSGGLSSIKETRICQDKPFLGSAKEDILGLNKTSRLAPTSGPFSLKSLKLRKSDKELHFSCIQNKSIIGLILASWKSAGDQDHSLKMCQETILSLSMAAYLLIIAIPPSPSSQRSQQIKTRSGFGGGWPRCQERCP